MPEATRVLAIGNVYPPHHLGGYEVIWRGVMRRLRADGHTTRVLVTTERRPGVSANAAEDPDVHRELEWYWHEHEWRRLGWRRRLALERRNGQRFDHHVADLRPHVIAWWSVGGLSLSLIERARRSGLRSILFVLDPWPSYGRERDLWLRGWARLGPAAEIASVLTGVPARVNWQRAGRWVFCSHAMQLNTAAAGLRAEPASILHPGVEAGFGPAADRDHHDGWNWRLLYVGRVVEQKGVETAVEALASLPPTASLAIVGEGDVRYRERLEAIAGRLGVASRVSFEGPLPREELPDRYRAADAVLFPVRWPEPWGLVPLEAMACEVPVIATGTGGSGEYLRDGENAVLFAAGDTAALARRCAALAADHELRARIVHGGRQTAAQLTEDAFNHSAAAAILGAAGSG